MTKKPEKGRLIFLETFSTLTGVPPHFCNYQILQIAWSSQTIHAMVVERWIVVGPKAKLSRALLEPLVAIDLYFVYGCVWGGEREWGTRITLALISTFLPQFHRAVGQLELPFLLYQISQAATSWFQHLQLKSRTPAFTTLMRCIP